MSAVRSGILNSSTTIKWQILSNVSAFCMIGKAVRRVKIKLMNVNPGKIQRAEKKREKKQKTNCLLQGIYIKSLDHNGTSCQ